MRPPGRRMVYPTNLGKFRGTQKLIKKIWNWKKRSGISRGVSKFGVKSNVSGMADCRMIALGLHECHTYVKLKRMGAGNMFVVKEYDEPKAQFSLCRLYMVIIWVNYMELLWISHWLNEIKSTSTSIINRSEGYEAYPECIEAAQCSMI